MACSVLYSWRRKLAPSTQTRASSTHSHHHPHHHPHHHHHYYLTTLLSSGETIGGSKETPHMSNQDCSDTCCARTSSRKYDNPSEQLLLTLNGYISKWLELEEC